VNTPFGLVNFKTQSQNGVTYDSREDPGTTARSRIYFYTLDLGSCACADCQNHFLWSKEQVLSGATTVMDGELELSPNLYFPD